MGDGWRRYVGARGPVLYIHVIFAFFPFPFFFRQPRFVVPPNGFSLGSNHLFARLETIGNGMIVGQAVHAGEVLRNCSCAWPGLALIVPLVPRRTSTFSIVISNVDGRLPASLMVCWRLDNAERLLTWWIHVHSLRSGSVPACPSRYLTPI